MATNVSMSIRQEAAMRSIVNHLSHFKVTTGDIPKRNRNLMMLQTLQLEWVERTLAEMAQQVIEDAIALDEEKAQIEREFQLQADNILGRREFAASETDVADGTDS